MKRSSVLAIICILFTSILVTSWANDVRWCRSRVQQCSRVQFTSLVSKRIQEIENKTRELEEKRKSTTLGPTQAGDSTSAGPPNPPTTTAAVPETTTSDPAGRRRKRNVLSIFDVDQFPSLEHHLHFRRKRQASSDSTPIDTTATKPIDPNSSTGPVPSGDTTPGHTGSTTPEKSTITITTSTTEPPNVSTPPPRVFRPDEWEETFYKCLDQIRTKNPARCKRFTQQRCAWNDGLSLVIGRYCRKWSVPCKACEAARG